MKISKQTTDHRKAIIISVVIAFILLLGFGIVYSYKTQIGFFGYYPFGQPTQKSINLEPPSAEEVKAGNDKKDEIISDDSTKPGNDQNSEDNTAGEGTNAQVPMTITSAQQIDTSARIRIYIDRLTTNGTCKLTMTGPAGKIFTEQVNVQPLSSYTTCKGFDIDTSKLSSGSWSINVEFNNNDIYGKATSNIEIM